MHGAVRRNIYWRNSDIQTILRVFLRRNQTSPRALSLNRETAMKIAKIILAGSAALTIISSAASQQALTGMVTQIDRINRKRCSAVTFRMRS